MKIKYWPLPGVDNQAIAPLAPVVNIHHRRILFPTDPLAAIDLLFVFSKTTTTTTTPPPSQNPRRPRKTLITATAMVPKTPHKPFLNPSDFQSPQILSDWLKPRLPQDFLTWGVKPGTKNVNNLWLELHEGEMVLDATTPPKRTVNVATVNIRNRKDDLLLESHQELSDGSFRERSRPLSEKMKPGECIEEAALRAIREELGSVLQRSGDGRIRILHDSYEKRIEERGSVSYPGLQACYILHSIEACVDCLPDGDFCTEENEYENCVGSGDGFADKAIVVKKHFWKWVPKKFSDSG